MPAAVHARRAVVVVGSNTVATHTYDVAGGIAGRNSRVGTFLTASRSANFLLDANKRQLRGSGYYEPSPGVQGRSFATDAKWTRNVFWRPANLDALRTEVNGAEACRDEGVIGSSRGNREIS